MPGWHHDLSRRSLEFLGISQSLSLKLVMRLGWGEICSINFLGAYFTYCQIFIIKTSNMGKIVGKSKIGFRKLVLKPTYICFHKCSYCKTRQKNYACQKKERTEIPLDTAKKVIGEAYKLGMRELVISGGDPLLYGGLVDLVEYINSYNDIVLIVNSVAAKLSNKVSKELILAGIDAWNISIDSPIPEVHNYIRGVVNAFEESMCGLAMLRKQTSLLGARTRFNFMTVITQINYETLDRLISLAFDQKIASIYLMKPYGTVNNNHLLTVQQIEKFNKLIKPKLLCQLESLGATGKIIKNAKYVLESIYNLNFATKENYAQGIFWNSDQAIKDLCKVPNYYMLIQANGDVLPCCAMEVAQDGAKVMGNIFNDSLSEIWESKKYFLFRKEKSLFCEACPINHNRTLGLTEDMCRQFLC